jgi:hypothetical protein
MLNNLKGGKIKQPPRAQKHEYIANRSFASINDAYARLAIAIVEQACKDANGYYSSGNSDKWNKMIRRKHQMEEVKKFFYEKYGLFAMCMPNTDGPAFYKQVMYNWEVYGYYTPDGKKEED